MKSKRTRWAEKNKNYMSDQAFADLKQALEDALAFEREDRRDLNVMRIRGSRQHNASRQILNRYLNPRRRF